jgi:hypothetical protein
MASVVHLPTAHDHVGYEALEVLFMLRFIALSGLVLTLGSSLVQPAWAILGAVSEPEPRFCADMLASVYHPETGAEVVARDLCEYNDLLEQGYLPEKPVVCAQAFGYVRHPETGNTLTYRNSCELQTFLKLGYVLLLRKP